MRLMPPSFLTVAALGGCAKDSGDDAPSDSATPVVVDVDGDGLDDVLVGAWADDDGGGNAGAAYVILTGG